MQKDNGSKEVCDLYFYKSPAVNISTRLPPAGAYHIHCPKIFHFIKLYLKRCIGEGGSAFQFIANLLIDGQFALQLRILTILLQKFGMCLK